LKIFFLIALKLNQHCSNKITDRKANFKTIVIFITADTYTRGGCEVQSKLVLSLLIGETDSTEPIDYL